MRRALGALALAAFAGCHRPPPATMEPVRLYVAPGLPAAVAIELARGFAIAEPTRVASVEEAELAWMSDPASALALGDRARPGSAPEQPGVPGAYVDPNHRFAPIGAVARVIVSAPGPQPALMIDDLRELADPRIRGQVALPRLDRGRMPAFLAAVELGYGERGTRGWLAQLAANRPVLVDDDAAAVEGVARGDVRYALADSITAGAAAARGAVRLTFTDQNGQGCLAIPTALVVLPGAGPGARKLAAWLTGPTAEDALVARAIGLLPLRDGAAAPPGILPLWSLRSIPIDWSALAEREPAWRGRLEGWPSTAGARP